MHYKAWLAQGFSQIGGVNYNNTYAPVAKLASSHTIITMANHLRLELHQVDIKGAYLNGVLNEVTRMKCCTCSILLATRRLMWA